jgi:hypothetical protein
MITKPSGGTYQNSYVCIARPGSLRRHDGIFCFPPLSGKLRHLSGSTLLRETAKWYKANT